MAKRKRKRKSAAHRFRVALAWIVGLGLLAVVAGIVFVRAVTGPGQGPRVRVHIPEGVGFTVVTDSLAAKDIVGLPALFQIYARLTGAAEHVKPGTYAFRRETGWRRILADLVAGRTLTEKLVIPEGWDLARIAPRLSRVSGMPEDSILDLLRDSAAAVRFHVPGPTLEGYLYPATYTFSVDLPVDSMIARMVRAYDRVWTPTRRARADSIGMSTREVVTLASIIEAEAKKRAELPLIAAVYENRLAKGQLLQADPTVQYALGSHHERLLYADIDSVAENPYNTYRHKGLPPGPIGSPSEAAIDAVLHPAQVDYLYFVARPDGTHIFTRTLAEHNRAKARVRAMRDTAAAAAAAPPASANASEGSSGTAPPRTSTARPKSATSNHRR